MTRNYGGVSASDSLYKAGKHAEGMPSTGPWDWLQKQVGKVGKKIKPFIDRNYR